MKSIPRSDRYYLILAASMFSAPGISAECVLGNQLEDKQSSCYYTLDNEAGIPEGACRSCSAETQKRNYSEDGAESSQSGKTDISFFFDNDLLVPSNSLGGDRNYTVGVGLSFSHLKHKTSYLAKMRDSLDEVIPIPGLHNNNPMDEIYSMDVGFAAFTPHELEEKEPIGGDRPYASLVYLSNTKLIAYNDNGLKSATNATKSTLVLGILGLGIVGEIQRFFHNDLNFSDRDPLGWDNQISDGGELTALYSIEKLGILSEDRDGRLDWDISYTVGGSVGYYTSVSAGFDLRLGQIITPFYSHVANPISRVIQPHVSNDNSLSNECNNHNDVYIFLGYRAHLVGYNALLQGQFRDSEVEVSGSQIERLRHEASIGLTFPFPFSDILRIPPLRLTYALHYRSEEHKGVWADDHFYAGIYLTLNRK